MGKMEIKLEIRRETRDWTRILTIDPSLLCPVSIFIVNLGEPVRLKRWITKSEKLRMVSSLRLFSVKAEILPINIHHHPSVFRMSSLSSLIELDGHFPHGQPSTRWTERTPLCYSNDLPVLRLKFPVWWSLLLYYDSMIIIYACLQKPMPMFVVPMLRLCSGFSYSTIHHPGKSQYPPANTYSKMWKSH